MTLSDLESLSEIFNDTKRRAVSMRQLSFLSNLRFNDVAGLCWGYPGKIFSRGGVISWGKYIHGVMSFECVAGLENCNCEDILYVKRRVELVE